MAYAGNEKYFAKWSSNLISEPSIFGFDGASAGEAAAAIKAVGYFTNTELKVNDLIWITANDPAVDMLYVSAIDGAGVVTTADAFDAAGYTIPSNTITNAMMQADSVNAANVIDAVLTKAKLATDVTDELPIFRKVITTVGGSVNESVTVTGAVTTDVVFASINTPGATPRAIVEAKVTADDTVNITWNGDPAADHKVNLLVIQGTV